MAKKKAPAGESKKADQKKKTKILEDKTFGLKNKNKSKKVQQHIQSVTKSVMNSGDRKQRQAEELRKQQRIDAKARKKAMEDERNALFGEALLAVKSKKTTNQKEGKTEAKGRDANDEDAKKKGTSRAMKMMYQMDAQEMEEKLREDPNYIPTLEDEIEHQRQLKVEELKKSGVKGTPVTEESFAVWQEAKRKRRAEAAKKLVEAEFKKKKGGKGLAVLSGRALYEYKKDLFITEEDGVVETTATTNGTDTDLQQQQQPQTSANGIELNDQQQHQVEQVAAKVQTNLFLEGDDDDLDDLDDDDEEE